MITLDDLRNDRHYKNAICSVNKLCSFELDFENEDIRKEYCKFCRRAVSYRKVNSRLDNRQYGFDHVRDFIQNGSPLFREIYGYRKPMEAPRKDTADDYRYMVRDVFKTVTRLESKAVLDKA